VFFVELVQLVIARRPGRRPSQSAPIPFAIAFQASALVGVESPPLISGFFRLDMASCLNCTFFLFLLYSLFYFSLFFTSFIILLILIHFLFSVLSLAY
jgi:hypothetical protein